MKTLGSNIWNDNKTAKHNIHIWYLGLGGGGKSLHWTIWEHEYENEHDTFLYFISFGRSCNLQVRDIDLIAK